jgi:hypothetical protein
MFKNNFEVSNEIGYIGIILTCYRFYFIKLQWDLNRIN